MSGTVLKAAAAVGACAAAGVVGLAFLFGGHGGDQAGTNSGSFYLEATITYTDSSSRAPLLGDQSLPEQITTGAAVRCQYKLKWWYQDVDHARVEVTQLTSAGAGDAVIVYDGSNMWTYRTSKNSYREERLMPVLSGAIFRPFLSAGYLGPVRAATTEEFMKTVANPTMATRVTGTERIVGRTTNVIELNTTHGTGIGTVARYSFDGDSKFVLKNEMRNGATGQGYLVEVTKLKLGVAIPDGKLQFQPPPGAKQID